MPLTNMGYDISSILYMTSLSETWCDNAIDQYGLWYILYFVYDLVVRYSKA